MRNGVGGFPWMRRAGSLLSVRPLSLTAARPWALRALLAWGVLAGLFFMHGMASGAGGCDGGAPVTAVTAMSMPPMSAAGAGSSSVSGSADLTAGGSAGRSPAVTGRHAAATSAPAPQSARAERVRDAGGMGMMCSSRQPREGFSIASSIACVAAAVLVVLVAGPVLPGLGGVLRRARPPGRPGLPLPLFLGVSRT